MKIKFKFILITILCVLTLGCFGLFGLDNSDNVAHADNNDCYFKNIYDGEYYSGARAFLSGDLDLSQPSQYVVTKNPIYVNPGDFVVIHCSLPNYSIEHSGFVFFYNDTYVGYSRDCSIAEIPNGVNIVYYDFYFTIPDFYFDIDYVEVYKTFSRNITFYDDDFETILHTESLTTELYSSYLSIPTKFGYNFRSWQRHVPYFTLGGGSGYTREDIDLTTYIIENDLKLYADYTKKQITYNFYDINGNELYFSKTLEFEDPINYDFVPILDNYKFLGWSTMKYDDTAIIDLNAPSFDTEIVDLYAVFDCTTLLFYKYDNEDLNDQLYYVSLDKIVYVDTNSNVEDFVNIKEYGYLVHLTSTWFYHFESGDKFNNRVYELEPIIYEINLFYYYNVFDSPYCSLFTQKYLWNDLISLNCNFYLDDCYVIDFTYFYTDGNSIPNEFYENPSIREGRFVSDIIYSYSGTNISSLPVIVNEDYFSEHHVIFIRVNYSESLDYFNDELSFDWTSLYCDMWQGESSDSGFWGAVSNIGENLALLIPRALYNFLIFICFGFGPISNIINFVTGGLLKLFVVNAGTLLELTSLTFIGPMLICILFLIFGLRLLL